MAHYAYLNNNNLVTKIIVGPHESAQTDWETYFSGKGEGRALRTSYNTRGGVHYNPETGQPSEDQSKALRGNYAGIGYTYDETLDAFIPPQPYESWVLDEATYNWVAPIPHPEDGGEYTWDEDEGDWTEVINETE